MSIPNITMSGNSNEHTLIIGSNDITINANRPITSIEDIPMPSKYFNTTNLAKMQKFVDDSINDNVRNLHVCIGNFKTNEDYNLLAGKQADGSNLTTDNYMRWASMTKILGGLTFTLALQKGLVSLDDEIRDYDSGFDISNLKILETDIDASGTKYVSGVRDGSANLDQQITFRHLLSMSTGFVYSWYIGGILRDSDTYKEGMYREYYIRDNYPDLWPQLDLQSITNGYVGNNYIDVIKQVPLLFSPGKEYSYSADYDILGYILSKVLEKKAIYGGNSCQMFIDEIANPIGATNIWFRGGQTAAPLDAAQKLTSVTVNVPTNASNVDVSNNIWGDNSELEGKGAQWLDDFSGTGLYKLSHTTYTQDNSLNTYGRGFGGGAAGPFTSFVKILKLCHDNGYHAESGKYIISPQFMSWFLESKVPDDRPPKLLGSTASVQKAGTWGFGFGRGNADPNEYASFKTYRAPVGFTNDTIRWYGWWRTNFQFDLKTGFYCVYGFQTPLNYGTSGRNDDIFPDLLSYI